MKFSLTIPAAHVKNSRQQVIKQAAKTIKVKGFRPGKAPLEKITQELDPNRINQEIIRLALPPIYQQYIHKEKLAPISTPRITPTSIADNQDWTFDIEIAQKPEVVLNDYQATVKQVKPGPKILKPGDPPPDPKASAKEEEAAIFQSLLETCQVTVPPLLLDEDVERSLSKLLEQVNKLGLTIDQYLASTGKDVTQLRHEYRTQAEKDLKLDFILDAIATDRQLHASQNDLEQFRNQITDPKAKEMLASDTYGRVAVLHALTQDKVLKYLKSL